MYGTGNGPPSRNLFRLGRAKEQAQIYGQPFEGTVCDGTALVGDLRLTSYHPEETWVSLSNRRMNENSVSNLRFTQTIMPTFLLNENSLADQVLDIIHTSIRNHVYMKDFSVDWRNMFPPFRIISSCDPEDQSRSAHFHATEMFKFRPVFFIPPIMIQGTHVALSETGSFQRVLQARSRVLPGIGSFPPDTNLLLLLYLWGGVGSVPVCHGALPTQNLLPKYLRRQGIAGGSVGGEHRVEVSRCPRI
jgi:hypothetical protein